jgi:hypothetical protein
LTHAGGARAFAAAFAILFTPQLARAADDAPSPSPSDAVSMKPASPQTGDPTDLPPRPPARARGMPVPDTATPSPPAPHGAYVHDGVFLRAGVGPGLFQAWSGRSADERTFNGGTVSIDAAVGGSPVRGFVIGAEYQTERVFSLSSTDSVVNGNEPDLSGTRFSTNSLAIFLDGYPDPTDGLHILGSIGVGWLDVAPGNTPSPTGLLLSAGAGYEWFVGPNVSLGVLLRGNLGVLGVNETGSASTTSVVTFVPSLLAVFTYN